MVDLLCYKLHTENMKRITFLFACIITIYSSMPAYAWGPKGHDIVAAIAEQNLTKKTKKALDKILDGKSIVYYSSWMDNIQNSPNWKNGYDKTKTWHYANVDKGLTYETMEKNKKGDVLTGLEFLVNELTVNFDNLSDSLKQDYVKMVVHMVGDMHCPMHAGRSTDRGGNGKKVKWFGQKTNLHSVWDSKMIDSARKWSYTEWVNHLDRKDKKYKKAIVQGTYQDWFTETVVRAEELYEYAERQGDEVPNFSYQYVYDFSPLLEDRLQTGGYRLAHVLNTIFN
jgi:hypothetical protein